MRGREIVISKDFATVRFARRGGAILSEHRLKTVFAVQNHRARLNRSTRLHARRRQA